MSRLLKRGDQFRRAARRLNVDYVPEDEWGILQQVQDFRLFRRGFRGRVRHVLSQEHALMESRVNVFDYRYLKWMGKSTKRVQQTVFFLESRKLGLPEFYMHPENFFHRIGESLGLTEDIDFEEYPRFSHNYRLVGEDEEYIRHHFQEPVLRFFALEKGWTLEGLGFYLILYRHGKLLKGDTIEALYRKGLSVYERLSESI